MSRTSLSRWLGFCLAGGVLLTMGTRPHVQAVQTPPGMIGAAVLGGAFGGSGGEDDNRHKSYQYTHRPMTPEATRTWIKLQEKVGMNFPTDTPLEDIKKFIEEVTADKEDPTSGIPMYFDPNGLADADKTMTSTVSIVLKKGIPLATSLTLLLDQVGLKYYIQKDGIVIVTEKNSEDVPIDLDEAVMQNLDALRTEVRMMRAELRMLTGRTLPQGGMMGSVGGSMPLANPPQVPPGGMGGGLR